jgi:Ca2+:H+ antiporter
LIALLIENSVFMLREGHLRIVLSSLLGSIFVNLLFILGVCIMSAGVHSRGELIYDHRNAQILLFFIVTGVLSLLIPSSLHAVVRKDSLADNVTLKFSRGLSIVLLCVYVMFVHFQMGSHRRETEALAKDVETGSSDSEDDPDSTDQGYLMQPVSPISRKKRHARRRSQETLVNEHQDHPPLHKGVTFGLLLASAGVVSVCAEFMVDSIEHVVEDAPLTEAFIGLIILPFLGNVAEMASAITFAHRQKIDLAINVAVGSGIQISLFMAPAMVIGGWIIGRDLSLYFDMFQVVTLVVTLLIISVMLLSGRCHYLLGMLLCTCYVVIG